MSKPIVKNTVFALSYLQPITFYGHHQGAQKICNFITGGGLRSRGSKLRVAR